MGYYYVSNDLKEMEKDDICRLGSITMFDLNSIYKSYSI